MTVEQKTRRLKGDIFTSGGWKTFCLPALSRTEADVTDVTLQCLRFMCAADGLSAEDKKVATKWPNNDHFTG